MNVKTPTLLPTLIRRAPVLAVGLLACACANAQDGLNAPAARISETAIHADHQAYESTQGRIKALNDKGVEVDNYTLSKAQCWLDTSFHEYTRNDRGGYPSAALGEANRLVAALEGGNDPGYETPLVNNAEKLRPDLWARYDALKKHAGFHCATQATACAEVELVHAGNEIHDGGWRHAKPYIQIAEDLTSQAEMAAANCPKPEEVTTERFDLSADALFKFDRGDLAGLLPAGRTKLDELAAQLGKTYTRVDKLVLVGHTDRLGSVEYNQALSEKRAATVKAYLEQHGVSTSIEASGHGEAEPVKQCEGGDKATPALVECLQPNRRVSVEITGVRAVQQQ